MLLSHGVLVLPDVLQNQSSTGVKTVSGLHDQHHPIYPENSKELKS